MVDKTVQKEEIEKLKELVQKEWLPVEDSSDIFGSDSAYQIEIVFDWLVEMIVNTNKLHLNSKTSS
ncbi:hypothetical protein FQU23_003625 [Flavobacterium sp. XN-5]|uniref:hypothetical protein n=1 Tax=Flavobacterium sp. XN-5 TaxID=2599390 RepID=UPI0011C89622|nr:hypothetical protein [Flavobacterium sp. XN-5]NGY36599.1 hypothetical protein [Flavobacterium sp. XN-5]